MICRLKFILGSRLKKNFGQKSQSSKNPCSKRAVLEGVQNMDFAKQKKEIIFEHEYKYGDVHLNAILRHSGHPKVPCYKTKKMHSLSLCSLLTSDMIDIASN